VQFGLQQFVGAVLVLVLSCGLLAVLSWQLTLVCLAIVPIVVVASVRFQRRSNDAYLVVRERVGQNLSLLQESLAGVRVIQAHHRTAERSDRFAAQNRALFDAHMGSVRISTWYFGLVEWAGIAAAALVVGIGGALVHRGTITIGTVAAFVLLLSNLFEPIQQLSQLFNTVQAAGASLHKLYGLLDEEPAVADAPDAVDLPHRGDIDLDGVTFAYPGVERPVLRSVTFTIAAGERFAIVGATGSGKSTIGKLIGRLYDPSVGSVRFGGVDLRQATGASLRSRIVVIPQEGYLFSGSVRDNLRLARPDATADELDDAVDRVGLTERFAQLPEGLDTDVGERGGRLSAGERQLVALVRAALVDPAVIILDEATSNLDPGTEAAVDAAMERLVDGRTVVVSRTDCRPSSGPIGWR
jgi:ATP-binding cassette, subfamily B, bacterial